MKVLARSVSILSITVMVLVAACGTSSSGGNDLSDTPSELDSPAPDAQIDAQLPNDLTVDTPDLDAVKPDLTFDILPDVDLIDIEPDLLEKLVDVVSQVFCPAGGVLVQEDCGTITEMGCCYATDLLFCGSGADCPDGMESCLCQLSCDLGESEIDGENLTPFCSFLESGQLLGCSDALTFPTGDNPPSIWCDDYVCPPQCDGKFCGPDECGGSCGSCLDGEFCTVDGTCEVICVPESDTALCLAAGAECGSIQTLDSCGATREPNCGECPQGETCSQTGQCESNCTPESDAALCLAASIACGTIQATDVCGEPRQPFCGDCAAPETCGGGGISGQCGCTPESDEAFCASLGLSCGEGTGVDNCGLPRTVSCGLVCPDICSTLAATRCQGNAVQTCVEQSGIWIWSVDLVDCEFGEVCSNGECTMNPEPPDPADIAPELAPLETYDVYDNNSFLWMGTDPVQFDVLEGAIEPHRISLARGHVLDVDGWPLSGIRVRAVFDNDVGFTVSRADGAYDFVVNGGSDVTLEFTGEGVLAIQRTFHFGWKEDQALPDVRMTAIDSHANEVLFGASATETQVAEGSPKTDAYGTRTARMLFAPGTNAVMELPDGTEVPLPDSVTVRATEYTVGPGGAEAMPANLPTGVAYTWCADFTMDEALEAGATSVRFDQPVAVHVENFLGFPVGGVVPVGYYNRQSARWEAQPDGLVIGVLDVADSLAQLDLSGTGTEATATELEALGITEAERAAIAQHYVAGQTLWRFQASHFSPWDCNWPFDTRFNEDGRSSRSREEDSFCKDGGCILHPVEQRCKSDCAFLGPHFLSATSRTGFQEEKGGCMFPSTEACRRSWTPFEWTFV